MQDRCGRRENRQRVARRDRPSPRQPRPRPWRALVLFHYSEREMGCSRCLKRPDVFQVDRRWAQVIEEANTLTQENMSNTHMQFVEQTRLQGLLDGACTMQGHIFLPCQLLCFRNR